MTNETLHLIETRRSHRAYLPTPLSEEQIQALVNAGLQSPTAVNRQPWHFSVVRNAELLDEMNEQVCKIANQRSAESRSPRFAQSDYHVFYHAPCVIFIFGDADNRMAKIDCGIAVENIALAAESMGLGSVILGMPRDAFTEDKKALFEARLQCPEGSEFEIAIAVGIPTDTKQAHPIGENKVSFID